MPANPEWVDMFTDTTDGLDELRRFGYLSDVQYHRLHADIYNALKLPTMTVPDDTPSVTVPTKHYRVKPLAERVAPTLAEQAAKAKCVPPTPETPEDRVNRIAARLGKPVTEPDPEEGYDYGDAATVLRSILQYAEAETGDANRQHIAKLARAALSINPAHTPEEVAERDPWGEDPTFSLADWRDAVGNNDTRLGYWPWVDSCIEASREVDKVIADPNRNASLYGEADPDPVVTEPVYTPKELAKAVETLVKHRKEREASTLGEGYDLGEDEPARQVGQLDNLPSADD